jgi:hypothetical protein
MTAPGDGGRIRRAVDWTFRNRRTGAITVAQWPNIALGLFIAVTIGLRLFHPSGTVGTLGRVVAGASLVIWALDELMRGVNPFRRMLGVVVLGAVIAGLALG